MSTKNFTSREAQPALNTSTILNDSKTLQTEADVVDQTAGQQGEGEVPIDMQHIPGQAGNGQGGNGQAGNGTQGQPNQG
ncbi:hypothetical protein BGX27_005482 [Mortierella sp. AM989]|nr:hypothetical protein BGX27_005482 [Mortierella sp. AM989]